MFEKVLMLHMMTCRSRQPCAAPVGWCRGLGAQAAMYPYVAQSGMNIRTQLLLLSRILLLDTPSSEVKVSTSNMPPIPPPPSTDGPHWSMPPQVQSCEDAAKNGNIQRVKELVQQLLQSSSPSSEAVEPQPKWFHGALTAAINRHDLDMVQYLLDENVATQDNHYVFEGTVRGRAFNVLELLLQRGWDINKTPTRVEPPVLTCVPRLHPPDFANILLLSGSRSGLVIKT